MALARTSDGYDVFGKYKEGLLLAIILSTQILFFGLSPLLKIKIIAIWISCASIWCYILYRINLKSLISEDNSRLSGTIQLTFKYNGITSVVATLPQPSSNLQQRFYTNW